MIHIKKKSMLHEILLMGEMLPDFSLIGYHVSAHVCTFQPWPSGLLGLHSCLGSDVVLHGRVHVIVMFIVKFHIF